VDTPFRRIASRHLLAGRRTAAPPHRRFAVRRPPRPRSAAPSAPRASLSRRLLPEMRRLSAALPHAVTFPAIIESDPRMTSVSAETTRQFSQISSPALQPADRVMIRGPHP
jgi:hypothetical protein